MGRKLQSIYELLSDYRENEIDAMINSLSEEERKIINERYGDDLHNPKAKISWSQEKSRQFYATLVPKMKKILQKMNSNLELSVKREHENVKKPERLSLTKYQKYKLKLLKEMLIDFYTLSINDMFESMSEEEINTFFSIDNFLNEYVERSLMSKKVAYREWINAFSIIFDNKHGKGPTRDGSEDIIYYGEKDEDNTIKLNISVKDKTIIYTKNNIFHFASIKVDNIEDFKYLAACVVFKYYDLMPLNHIRKIIKTQDLDLNHFIYDLNVLNVEDENDELTPIINRVVKSLCIDKETSVMLLENLKNKIEDKTVDRNLLLNLSQIEKTMHKCIEEENELKEKRRRLINVI